MRLEPTTNEDIETLTSWSAVDIDTTHQKIPADFWLTGNGYFSAKVVDDEGTAFFVRFDKEGDSLRLNTQFAPYSEVSKKRITTAINGTFPAFIEYVKQDGIQSIVFETREALLANWMMISFGFRPVENTTDYILRFKSCPDCKSEVLSGDLFHLESCEGSPSSVPA